MINVLKSIVFMAGAILTVTKTISGMEMEIERNRNSVKRYRDSEHKTSSIGEETTDNFTMGGVLIPVEVNEKLLKFFITDCHKKVGPLSNFKFVCKRWSYLMETDNFKNFVKSCNIVLPTPTVEEVNEMLKTFHRENISEFIYHGLSFTLECPTPIFEVRKFSTARVVYYASRIRGLTYSYDNNTTLILKQSYCYNVTYGSLSKNEEKAKRGHCSYCSTNSGKEPITYCISFDHTRGIYRLNEKREPLSNLFSNHG